MNVLIVDDHAMFGDALQMLLSAETDVDDVTVVGTAEEALEMCGRRTPHVVLMDVNLPGLNGIDATRELLAHCPEANVVVISALHDPQLMARAVEAGASGFVAKTRAADELVQVVRAAAQGEIVLPDARAGDILRELGGMRRRSATMRAAPELSARELEVLQAFADGLSTGEAAARLFISERTVQSHIRSILSKLQMSSKLQAVLWGLRQGKIHLRAGD